MTADDAWAPTLLVAGTASHVGKSTVAAGLRRLLADRGVDVAHRASADEHDPSPAAAGRGREHLGLSPLALPAAASGAERPAADGGDR